MGEVIKTEELKIASLKEAVLKPGSPDLSFKKRKEPRFAFFLNINVQVDKLVLPLERLKSEST